MKYMKDAQPFGSLLYTTEMDDLNDGNSHRDFNSVSPLIRKITEGEDAETVYKNAGRTVLKDPSAAIIFSGTENQFRNYFKTTGNGEISRFFFIRLNGGAFKTLAEDYEEDNSLLELEKWREGVILGVSKYFERYSFKIEFSSSLNPICVAYCQINWPFAFASTNIQPFSVRARSQLQYLFVGTYNANSFTNSTASFHIGTLNPINSFFESG